MILLRGAGSKLKIPIILMSLGLLVIACQLNNKMRWKILFLFGASLAGLAGRYKAFFLKPYDRRPNTAGFCV